MPSDFSSNVNQRFPIHAKSNADDGADVVLWADPTTHRLLVDSNGDTQYQVDDAAGATDFGTAALAVRDDALTTLTPADGDYVPLRTDSLGNLWVTLGTQLDRTQDNVGVAQDVNVLMDDTTALTVKRAAISASTSGNNTLVAAVSGKNIRVVSAFFVVAADVDVRFEDGAGGTALTGVMSYKAGSGLVLPYNPTGHFETSDNTLLNLELGGAVQVSGALQYVEV